VWSVVPFSSLVEHIKLMFVGVVELSRTYFSRMEQSVEFSVSFELSRAY